MSPYTTGHYTGNSAPFLYTPTSLLLEHSVLTDVQQATGRNGQQWITCRSGGEGTRPEIWMGSELVPSNSTANSAKILLGSQHPNGLYHCLSAQSQREHFSLFFRNSGTYLIFCIGILYAKPISMWDDTLSEFVEIHIMHNTTVLYLFANIILPSLYIKPLYQHQVFRMIAQCGTSHQMRAEWRVHGTPQCGPSHHQMAVKWRDIL